MLTFGVVYALTDPDFLLCARGIAMSMLLKRRMFLRFAALLVPTCIALPSSQADAGDQVFASSNVTEMYLTMSAKQWDSLQPAAGFGGGPGFGGGRGFGGAPGGTGQPGEEKETPDADVHHNTFGVEFPWSSGDLEYQGQTYRNVGIRYKGNYTFMATSQSLKKSFKIDINRNVDDQKLDGMSMLNLHCGVSDPTMSRETLSYAFFREAGVPAPRTVFTKLFLTVPGKYDKELVGVYTMTEQVNKPFLKKHFGDSSGMLLKPEGLQGGPVWMDAGWKAYEEKYRPDNKPKADQKMRLISFTKLVSESSDEDFSSEIGSYLDIDAFLRFIAANALLSNLDSYLGYGHNYYLYLVPSTNKFVFIPWDLDLSMATWPAAGTPEQLVDLSIHHPHSGDNTLIDRLFSIAEHKERYVQILRELTEKKFTKERLFETLVPVERALEGPLAEEAKVIASRNTNRGQNGFGGFGPGPGFGGQFGQSMPPRRFIDERIESVTAQLAGKRDGFVPRPFGFPGR
ncbi:MAG: CotH kinase family protein [Planctomyces sp.]|nr:CotH kinase family protein [Planctomyces sp.]